MYNNKKYITYDNNGLLIKPITKKKDTAINNSLYINNVFHVAAPNVECLIVALCQYFKYIIFPKLCDFISYHVSL